MWHQGDLRDSVIVEWLYVNSVVTQAPRGITRLFGKYFNILADRDDALLNCVFRQGRINELAKK